MTSCITSNSRGVSKSSRRRASFLSAARRRCSAERTMALSTLFNNLSRPTGFGRKSTAPDFMAWTHIGTSACPVMKMSCSSRWRWIRACWKSIPVKPGIRTSTITHDGPGYGKRVRKSVADSKTSLSYLAKPNNRFKLFRTDSSSSIMNTRGPGEITLAFRYRRDSETEPRAAAVNILRLNFTAMGFNYGARNCQTHPEPIVFGRVEVLEEPLLYFIANSNALIAHANANCLIAFPLRDNLHLTFDGRHITHGIEGIVYKINQDLLNLDGIAYDDREILGEKRVHLA